MSYRDVRNFIEMTRALGYPNLISMESFRQPNFPLVANLLVWLSKRFDPDCEIPLSYNTEDERIQLIRQIAEFMVLKANIKLNTKRLYQADGYAIKELLKIITILYEALNGNNVDENDRNDGSFDDDNSLNLNDFDLNDKINELKLTRQLASEITTSGATLFDLLGKEGELRVARQKSLGRQFELNDIEDGIRKAIETIKNEITETKQLIDNVSVTEANLDSKIERRKIEIDRYEKRLQTLKKVRPAFLEEFTELEAELEQLFIQYSLRLRILNQLERQFNESERAHFEKQLQLTSPRIEPIPLEIGNDKDDDVFLDNLNETKPNRQDRPRASTGGRSRTGKGAKAYGSMQPPISATPSLSSETETDDELFIDKDESELMHSDDESLNLEISEAEKRTAAAATGQNVGKLQNSDDEF